MLYAFFPFPTEPSGAWTSASPIQSTSCPPEPRAPTSTNLRLKRPNLPVVELSSSASSLVSDETFHIGLLVTSRVSRITERGDVVQCVNVEPSERITRCGNCGTTGLGSLFGRRFQTCVRPYGEDETLRVWVFSARRGVRAEVEGFEKAVMNDMLIFCMCLSSQCIGASTSNVSNPHRHR